MTPIVRRTPEERTAYEQGLRAGVDIALTIIGATYGEEVADELRPDTARYLDLIGTARARR